MVKLIASDLDGTILRNGAQSVEPSTIKAIEQLVNKGMYFAPASGRQIVSLKRLFAPFLKRACSCAPPLRKSVPDSELLSPEGREFFLNTSSLLPNLFGITLH